MEEKKEFKPFIPAEKVVPEFTVVSVVIGLILAVVFGAANAYLGLRVGMTVSASIPAAVISMGVIRVILRRDSILENNMVQTIGSAGESLAAGVIFTMPALFMWAQEGVGEEPSFVTIAILALVGGVLGVLFMVPLRTALIVEEHGKLTYPEGTACAEVLLAGEEGGEKSKVVFSGLGIAAVYKFIADGLKLFPSEVDFAWEGGAVTCGVGGDVLPALAGVGFICGAKVSSYLFAGGTLAWFVLIPAIAYFGGDAASRVADGAGGFVPFSELGVWGIWSNYIKYIGAGAVAAGGVISLIETFPTMVKTFKKAVGGFGKKSDNSIRTQQDLPMPAVLIGILALVVLIWLLPTIPVNFVGALIIVVFGFFFATVSSRMVGVVGSSNNPVSGMAIATLLVTTILLKSTGTDGSAGMLAAISIGSIVCVIACMAGDTSQDLKTGYIVGATPKKQQIGELLGTVISALAIGGVLYLLNEAWGFGSKEIAAPQASLMKMVVEGVMGGTLPWVLIFIGAAVAVVVKILGIPVLAFAIGLYLPIHLSTPIMVGGAIKWLIDNNKKKSEEERKEMADKGILYSAGLIAGEGIVGILLAIFAVIGIDGVFDLSSVYGDNFMAVGNWVGLAAFALLSYSIVIFAKKKSKKNS